MPITWERCRSFVPGSMTVRICCRCRRSCWSIRSPVDCIRARLTRSTHLRTLGLPAVLSDGDVVFQPRKVQRSGIWDAVEGRVLIYLHKERMLDAMQRRFPASHYVMVDDKPQLLAAMKRVLGEKLTTVFVRQGHYAVESTNKVIDPAARHQYRADRRSARCRAISISLHRTHRGTHAKQGVSKERA